MLRLPGYDDLVLVGEGGLGRVYRARRVSTGGTVAIKELHDVAEASPAWHRALREVEAMLRLKGHPNVVSVEEVLIGPGGPCIVMEFLSGGSLHDRLQRGHLSVPEVVLVGQQVSSALSAAHVGGVIHRDVKPHNLLVSGFGHVKVADFGIAALMRDSGVKTQTQSLTLAYASPEELDGALDVGPPTDVYSLAATLAHLATGQKPSFRDRSLSSLPFDLEPELVHVGQVLRRSLAIEPDQRPQMSELVVLFDDAQTRLGGRRIGNLPHTASPVFVQPSPAPQSAAMYPNETTIRRPIPAATVISPRQQAAPPPPPMPPIVVPAAAQAAPRERSTGGRTTLIVVAAVLATLLAGGVGFLVAGRASSKGDTAVLASTATTLADDLTPIPAVPASDPTLTITTEPTFAPTPTEPSAPVVTLTTIASTVPPDPMTIAVLELQRLVTEDGPTARSLVGRFVPQLSAKYVGLVDQGVTYGPVEVLADHMTRRDSYGAILVDSGAFQFEHNGQPMLGWFLSIVPETYSTKAEATQWCTDHGLGTADCFGREFKPAR